jgi:hypothetical protein
MGPRLAETEVGGLRGLAVEQEVEGGGQPLGAALQGELGGEQPKSDCSTAPARAAAALR